jgi:glucose/arabinose dehydrogenase
MNALRTALRLAALLALATHLSMAHAARVDVLAEGLERPWALAILPEGGYLVTLRGGSLLRLDAGGAVVGEITGVPESFFAGQGGLMDVVLDPDFAANRRLYLSYAHGTLRDNATRIHAATLDGDALVDGETIFEARPRKTTPQHYGARMAFLPDGTLLLTTGDGFDHREDAQRTSGLLGKVVRIHSDGRIPEDNPFVDDADAAPEVWSYGHRNPQGLTVAPDGTVWEHEHGPAGGDEVNRIEPAVNYGWPVATHGMDYIGARISPFEEYPGMAEPDLFWTPSIAPSGLAYYGGDAFPAWQGGLLVGGLAIVGLYHVDIVDGRASTSERVVPEIDERVREVRAGPDGLVYLLTDGPEGRLLRLRPDA